jgi:hypothetical protein
MQPVPSDCIIRVTQSHDAENPIRVYLFNIEHRSPYALVDWRKILDYEVRVEDNLQVSDAQIIALCPEANDDYFDTESDHWEIFGDGKLEYIEEDLV